LLKTRYAAFDRILENAPVTFTAAQFRVFLRALVTTDPYSFGDDVATFLAGDEDYSNERAPEEVLLLTIDGLADEKLTGFALRLALTAHRDRPEQGDYDLLKEADSAFPEPQIEEASPAKKRKAPNAKKALAKPHSAAKKRPPLNPKRPMVERSLQNEAVAKLSHKLGSHRRRPTLLDNDSNRKD